MADPVLSAVLSGQRAILLSWTFGSNADFQVFWKSSNPPGQEYVLLATTNAFSYTTPDLDPPKTYFFYVKANIGQYYYYSNIVELFVSCGKGVILSVTPPPPPPSQIDEWLYRTVDGGDIYKLHLGGDTDWVPLNQTVRRWSGITCCPNGDVWACTIGYPPWPNMYVQRGGVGDFVVTPNQPPYSGWQWRTLCSDKWSNIYAWNIDGAVGYFYKDAASDVFSWVSQPAGGNLYITGCTSNKNGDTYAATNSNANGLIWKRTNGQGNFVGFPIPPGGGHRGWESCAWSKMGHLYCGNNGAPVGFGIGRYVNGGGFPEAATVEVNYWTGLAASRYGYLYGMKSNVAANGYLYKLVGDGMGLTMTETLVPNLNTSIIGVSSIAMMNWWL